MSCMCGGCAECLRAQGFEDEEDDGFVRLAKESYDRLVAERDKWKAEAEQSRAEATRRQQPDYGEQ